MTAGLIREHLHDVADTADPVVAAPAAPAVAAAVDDIADPSTATAEDVATTVNELLASLRDAGILAE